MKKAIAAAVLAAPLAAAAQVESYVIDPYHTVPYFEVDHLGFATMRGRFDRATGKFSIDRAAKTGSVELEIPTATVNSGDTDRGARPRTRDEHLKNADFFNVQEFPTMTFKSTKVVFKGEEPAALEGNLTMLGVTKPITLNLDRWKCGPDVRTQGKRYQCGGNATGSFKRSDFGMKFGLPSAIGDEVKLWMSFYGFKQ
ncbi:MAG TPA: YceI family protein [Burkholderiales bacterium]|nr:YceI family protein [Burkholderiales bacterium]